MAIRTSRSAIDAMAASVHGVIVRSQCGVKGTAGRSAVLEQDLDVIHFRQAWPTSSCMLTNISGPATSVQMAAWTTVVVVGEEHHVHCDGRLAYVVCHPNDTYRGDLGSRRLADRIAAVNRYGTDV